MRFYITCLSFALISFFQLNAQDNVELRSIHDPQLQQLLKENKHIHFVKTYGPKGGRTEILR